MTTIRGSTRTVTLRRGAKGYGFTLAEQFPCYLSHVHEGGKAEKKGLLVGDRLLAINNVDVTRKPHKDIVELIASANDDELQLTVVSSLSSKPPSSSMTPSKSTTTSDSDSDNEIWRRQRIHLARRMKHRAAGGGGSSSSSSSCQRRHCINNSITPISESLTEKEQLNNAANGKPTERTKQKISTGNYYATNTASSNNSSRSRSVGGGRRYKDVSGRHHHQHQRYGSVYYSNTSSLKSNCKNKSCKGKYSRTTMNRSRSEPDFMREERWLNEASMIVNPGDDSGTSSSTTSETDDDDCTSKGIILKVVLVYIGAVPVPHLHMSRKHVVRSALQSLKAQNVRAHTVLLEIFSHQIVVTNSKGVIVNRFKSDCVAFVTPCAENKQFFGVTIVHRPTDVSNKEKIVETAANGVSAVCHVFAVDPELHLHSFHYNYAKRFGLRCSKDGETNYCSEFPYISSPVLHALSYVVRTSQLNKPILTTATVHNHRRGYHSSNSDSGIGNGREDYSPEDSAPVYSTTYAGTQKANLRSLNRNEFLRSSDDISQTSSNDRSSSFSQAGVATPTGRTNGNLKVRFDDAANSFIETCDASSSTDIVRKTRTTSASAPAAPEISSTSVDVHNPPPSASVCKDVSSTTSTNVNVGTSTTTNVQISKDVSSLCSYKASGAVSFDQQTDVCQQQQLSSKSKKSHSEVDLLADTPSNGGGAKIVQQVVVLGSSSSCSSSPKHSYPKRSSSNNNNNNSQRRHLLYCSSSVNDVSQLTINNVNNCCDGFSDDDDVDVDEEDVDRHSLFAVPAPVLKSFSTDASSISFVNSNHNNNNKNNNNNSTVDQNEPSTKHGSLLKRLGRIDMRLSVRMKQARKERLELWANDFDKLLRDPAGLHAFSEFLRKQYCQENINFWIACENFKVVDENERTTTAKELYDHYFASGCVEPVNVDATARQTIQDLVSAQKFTSCMFNVAQYQIFHLMKYDCYPRFLKSDDYHQCWEVVDKGQQLTEMKEMFLKNFNNGPTCASNVSLAKTNASKEDDKKRKSILPWKTKFGGGGRKKKHDSLEHGLDDDVTVLSHLGNKRKHAWRSSKHLSTPAEVFHTVNHHASTSARTSPTRLDAVGKFNRPPDVVPQPDPPSSPSPGPSSTSYLDAEPSTSACCTAILPSGERVTIGLPGVEKISVGEWVNDVARRYRLNPDPTATTVVDTENNEAISSSISARKALENKTIRVESRVLITINIPCSDVKNSDRKKVTFKASAASTSAQALIPVLNKYGLSLDNMVITIDGTNEVLPNHAPIINVNDKELVLRTQEEFQEWLHRDHDDHRIVNKFLTSRKLNASPSASDDRRMGKLKDQLQKNCVTEISHDVKTIPLSNATKAGGMLKFVKKPENKLMDRKSSASVKGPKVSSAVAVVARSRKSTASLSREEMMQRVRDEKKLAELLNRAQASSFDDQRGSAVKNCELPEFLKPKNMQQISMDDSLLLRHHDVVECRPTDMVHRKLCASPQLGGGLSDEQQSEEDLNCTPLATLENFDEDTLIIPSHEEAERLFGGGVVDDDTTLDFSDPNLTERKSLSDFGMTTNQKSNNVSIVAVCDDSKTTAIINSNFKRTIRESPSHRRPPPPYPGHNNRASLKKSSAIDETATDELNNYVVEKRKGLYVDEEDDWQVDYV